MRGEKRVQLFQLLTPAVLLAGLLVTGPALAAGAGQGSYKPDQQAAAGETKETLSEAQKLVDEAVGVVEQMQKDPDLSQLMQQARGIYIVPDFGRGALVVGAHGGGGVMLSRESGSWTGPMFYDLGAISIGAQAGGSAGSVALLLMSDRAVRNFENRNSFSLNAEAGLSIIDYSAGTQASWGKGDVILWSDTEGAYAGAAVSVDDIRWDQESNRAYYGKEVTPEAVLTEKVQSPHDKKLRNALSG